MIDTHTSHLIKACFFIDLFYNAFISFLVIKRIIRIKKLWIKVLILVCSNKRVWFLVNYPFNAINSQMRDAPSFTERSVLWGIFNDIYFKNTLQAGTDAPNMITHDCILVCRVHSDSLYCSATANMIYRLKMHHRFRQSSVVYQVFSRSWVWIDLLLRCGPDSSRLSHYRSLWLMSSTLTPWARGDGPAEQVRSHPASSSGV